MQGIPFHKTSQAFSHLVQCLNGSPPTHCNWKFLLQLANNELISPTLYECISRYGTAPDEVCTYLMHLYNANQERNRRLRNQALEAIRELNTLGIEPVLLKGACFLLSDSDERVSSRIITDLDVLIPDTRAIAAIAKLGDLGYRIIPCNGEHVYCVVGRNRDVGTIDLHHHSPGSNKLHTYEYVLDACSPLDIGGIRALIPSAEMRIAQLVMHDMLHDLHLAKGELRLRRLWDVRSLMSSMTLNWTKLIDFFPEGRPRLALASQLVAAKRLFGTNIPAELEISTIAKIHYLIRLYHARYYPILSFPYRVAHFGFRRFEDFRREFRGR